jgi:hypothetical protein
LELQRSSAGVAGSKINGLIEAVDEDGFLKKEYYANDATHANDQYGASVIKQLMELI